MNHAPSHQRALATRIEIRTTWILVLSLLLAGCLSPAVPLSLSAAYIETGLLSSTAQNISVIVSATDGDTAAQAVRRMGGTVTSDLWLIGAVAATLPAKSLAALAAQPGIASIVTNQRVDASNGPQCDPDVIAEHGPCANRPGWVTDRREKKGQMELPNGQKSPIVPMPDGRFVAVGDKDTVVFLNSDGSFSNQVTFPFKGDGSRPVIGPNGSIYFTSEKPLDSAKTILYALNSDGSVRWSYEKDKIVPGGLALSPDGQYVYLASTDVKLYVFDAFSGNRIVEAKPHDDKGGLVTTGPVVGADGTIYLQTSGKEPEKSDLRGNLIALDPTVIMNGDTRDEYIWRYVATSGDLLIPLDFAPVIDVANNLIYITSESKKFAIGVDASNGSQRFLTPLAKRPTAKALVAPDGLLYVPAEEHLYAMNGNGAILTQMDFAPLKIEQMPTLLDDPNTLYVTAANKLFAVDRTSNTVAWQVSMAAKIVAQPVQDTDGNIVVGSEGEDLVVVRPAGVVTSRLIMDDKITTAAIPLDDSNYLVRVGDKSLVGVGFLPEDWDNRPDAEPADGKRIWNLSNPIAIDVGADVVHETVLPNGSRITGQGVTIAVLDSGIYFDSKVKEVLGENLDDHFLGQGDFVEYGLCEDGGVQHFADSANTIPLYCASNRNESIDLYGHGSHVAGIIWSQILDYATGVSMGIAPDANILSVRVLDENGAGTYADAIEGLQYVVANKDALNIRIVNMSLSAYASTPYFIDPLNRAVEQAWAAGLVVIAAAGNVGPNATTITVPGNDPYVITVGALNNQRTPGYWSDDVLPTWSATGPTLDGFVKPDVLAPGANIISFLHNDDNGEKVANLASQHPDYSRTSSLFRMNGTSMATAVVSGVAALMLQANPNLTPDQVKFRLGRTARPALTSDNTPMYNIFQQGMGRIWAPAAVLANLPAEGRANQGLDIQRELADYADGQIDLANHFQGPVKRLPSDDATADLYYIEEPVLDGQGNLVDTNYYGMGASRNSDRAWIDWETQSNGMALWSGGMALWSGGLNWAGGVTNPSGMALWSGGMPLWSGGLHTWSQGMALWSGGMALWSGGMALWSGGMALWSGAIAPSTTQVSATNWVNDDGTVEAQPILLSAPEPEEPIVYPENVALCPASVTLTTSADAFIDQERSDRNYGSANQLLTKPENGKKKHALYQFDLNTLPGDALIQDARFLITSGSSRSSHAVVFRAMETLWNEASVSWLQPSSGESWAEGSFSTEDTIRQIYDVRVPVGGNTQLSINLTDLVKDWHKGRTPNAGIAMIAVGTDTGDAKWYSREEGTEGRRPQLRIDFLDPTEGGCPQVNSFTALADTYLNAARPNDFKGGDSKLLTLPQMGKQVHSLVQFDLSYLPAGVRIDSAELVLTSRRSRTNHSVEVRRMLSGWATTDPTWNSPNSGSAQWAGGGFGSADYGSVVYGTLNPVGGDQPVAVNVTELVNDWVNSGVANQGFALVATGSDTGAAEWYSGNDGTATRRPQLIVHWTLPVGMEMPASSASAFSQPVALAEEELLEDDVLFAQQLFLPTVNR